MAVEHAVIVLMRAVNVGGNNKLPMARLREVLTAAGLTDVRTYIQSGNVVCRSRLKPAKVAELVTSVIVTEFGLQVPAVALSHSELAQAIAQWPVPHGALPKTLHCIVLEKSLESQQVALIEAQVGAAQSTGSEDFAEVIDRFIYLYTPDGIGNSKLARQLSTPKIGGTARNWNTANTLLEMASGRE
jgi:uncharacterized protein (DUF1697 family)